MANPTRTMTVPLATAKRIRAASKFFDVRNYEIIDLALDQICVPRISSTDKPKESSARKIQQHVATVSKSREGRNEELERYFKRVIANDN